MQNKKRNSQQELVDYLKKNPMKTEKEICTELWGEKRDKKHADLIRRALYKGRIERVKFKIPGDKGRALIHYYEKTIRTLYI
jgi:hypothetical protein